MNRLVLSSLCLVPFLLAGCGAGTLAGPELNVASDAMSGRMMGGNQPVVGATISVYEVGSSAYGTASTTAKASTFTDGSGFWSFAANAYTCTTASTPMYIVAAGGNTGAGATNANSYMMALVPQCGVGRSSYFWINEVTTAAAVMAAGQFMGTGLGSANVIPQIGGTCSGCGTGTYNRGLVAAFSNTYPQLVNNATGTAITSGTTNGLMITRESAKLYSMANVLAACVNSAGTTGTGDTTSKCAQLFTDVNVKNSNPGPSTTIQAMLLMDLYPYSVNNSVSNTYALGGSTPPFTGLSTAPNDWTLGISYKSTNFGLGISQNTSSSLDIDASGNVWLPTNSVNTAGLIYFSPSTTSVGGPFGLFSGIYPQYVAVDTASAPAVWMTDAATNYLTSVDATSHIITPYAGSAFTYSGPITIDSSDDVVFAGNGSSSHSIYYVPPTRSTGITQAGYQPSPTSPVQAYSIGASPNGVAAAISVPESNGYVYITDTTSACTLDLSPGIADYEVSVGDGTCVTGGALATLFGYFAGYGTASAGSNYYICVDNFAYASTCQQLANLNNPKAMAADGAGHIWVANAGNASVASYAASAGVYQGGEFTGFQLSAIGTTAYLHGTGNGVTMTVPYGIGIDGSGNVWTSNAGCVSTSSTRCNAGGSYVLSEMIGAAVPTITPVGAQADGNFGTRPSN